MTDTNWLEIVIVVDGEMAEAVAEVLSRYVPNGVVITGESDKMSSSPKSLRVCGYLPVNKDLEANRQKIEQALWYLGRIHQPIPTPVYRTLQETNWVENWKKHYRPIPIARRLLVLPAWYENPEPDRIPIRIEPGMAFGTGTHPSTQLVLELLEDYVQEGEGVIDIGCGSGILSIAAIKLGANPVLGVDVDTQSIESARENVALNSITAGIELGIGSLTEIKAGMFSLKAAKLVVANILAPVLIRLLDEGLKEIIDPGGGVILSGILEDQASDIINALDRHGLRLVDRRQTRDWIALMALK
jgi:ribosomal protein L11 methyltransferase